MVRKIVRYEAVASLILLCYVYFLFGYHWWLLVVMLFMPDLAMLFYFMNSKVGRIAYNLIHTYAIPILAVLLDAMFMIHPLIRPLCLIWMVHISMDRVIGYGLKYDSFKETHLQKL